jgi:DNA-binding response OmpR family regulator
VRQAVGARVGARGREIAWTEVATHPVAMAEIDAGGQDLLILDGEAGKLGGMGLARVVRDEVTDPPPILLLLARPQDAWLATWSGADRTVPFPVGPFELARVVAEMLGEDA